MEHAIARGIGHVDYLTRIAPPRIGVVLNVGSAHLGEFGSRANIARAKSEIVAALRRDLSYARERARFERNRLITLAGLVGVLCAMIGYIVWNGRRHRRALEQLATTDALTGLANRRAADDQTATALARATGADCVAIDNSVDAGWAAAHVQKDGCVQGNLNPRHMVTGGPELVAETRRIVDAFRGGPHIFNLGHGIVPDTPIAHVERLLARVRG